MGIEMGIVVNLFLLASGVLFWMAICMAVWIERRSKRFLKDHPEEWPEPVFRRLAAQPAGLAVLLATLRRDAARLGETISSCREGTGIVAIEDMAIRDEINKALAPAGLMVVEKD